jgi:exonuclease SbcC
MEKEIQNLQERVSTIKGKIDSAPTEIIDPIRISMEKETATSKLNSLVKKNKKQKQDIGESKQKYEKIIKFLAEFDINVYEKKKELFAKSEQHLDKLILELERLSSEKTLLVTQRDNLCDACVPIITTVIEERQKMMGNLSIEINAIGESHNFLEREKVNSYVDKYQKVREKKIQLSEEITTTQLLIDKSDSNIVIQKTVIEKLNDKLKQYEDNREAIENLEELISQKDSLQGDIGKVERECASCKKETNNLFREVGSAEQQIKNLEEDKEELESLRTEFAAFELFMRCFHTNGISYNIIKNRLPVINDEVAKILTGIVDFEVFILNEDKKLDIFIKHPKFEPRPLEMGSGAEKTIASMAIRLALLSVSSLPKPDIFILDEPGTALDEDNMEGFVRIIDMVKSYFKTVILISHLDTLKDAVDTQIVIDKKKGFAHVSV